MAGAPTKYKPKYKNVLLDLMKQGASIEEICLELDVCKQTLYNWFEQYPEFLECKNRGIKTSRGKSRKSSKKYLEKLKKRREKRNYKKEYKNNKIAYSKRSLLYYHLKKQGASKSKKTFDLFGYEPVELVTHIKSKLKEGMTLENYGKWHIDHIKPLSLFDLRNPNEIKKAWSFDNLQPLWAKENISKSNKYG